MKENVENYDLPDFLHGLFCNPSPMHGENAEVYARLYAQVVAVVQPKDIFDQMMACDVTNHFWEQQRIRRCTGTVIDTARRQALVEVLAPMVGYLSYDARKLADLYFGTGEASVRTREPVIELLRKHGLDETAIDTQSVRNSVPTLGAFEGLILKHEVRRDAILREFERRRELRAQRRGADKAQHNGKELQEPSLADAPA